MGLVDFINDSKQVSIKKMLHERTRSHQKARSPLNIHASAVTSESKKFCPRKQALLITLKVPDKEEFIDTAMQITFNTGWDMQHRVNNDYLRDVMIGGWLCKSCGQTKEYGKAPMTNCAGKTCQWEYEELRVKSDVCGISGGIDGVVDINCSKHKLLEYKTIDKDAFKTLSAPLSEHRARTALYLRLLSESSQWWAKHINQNEATIIYQMKGYGVKCEESKSWNLGQFSPFKEFTIKRDDKLTQQYVDLARPLYLWMQKKAPMPKGICPSAFCDTATYCPVHKECFSGAFK